MNFRYFPQNLSMNEAAPVCQHWNYASAHSMESMLEKDYFLSAADRLRPGDTIRVIQMRDTNIHSKQNVVIAFCDALVVQVGKDGVFLFVSPITVIKDKPIIKPASTKRVQWNPGKKKHEVFYGDEVVLETGDKAEAEAWQPKQVDVI